MPLAQETQPKPKCGHASSEKIRVFSQAFMRSSRQHRLHSVLGAHVRSAPGVPASNLFGAGSSGGMSSWLTSENLPLLAWWLEAGTPGALDLWVPNLQHRHELSHVIRPVWLKLLCRDGLIHCCPFRAKQPKCPVDRFILWFRGGRLNLPVSPPGQYLHAVRLL